MRSLQSLSAAFVLAALTAMAGQQEKPVAAAPAQSEPALQYRILQLVSAGNTEQQINEAAASGYRFLMLQPSAGATGVTVLLKRVEQNTTPYQYRLVLAEPGKDRLQRALNQAGSGGFRLVADSLLIATFAQRGAEVLLWPSAAIKGKQKATIYVAVAEKAPGGSMNYEYRVTSAMRESAVQKDLREISGQGFTPVVSTMELPSFVPRFVVVFEKDPGGAPQSRAEGKYVYAKIGEFPSSADNGAELTIDVTAAMAGSSPKNEGDNQAEPEQQDTPGDAGGESWESGPPKPTLHADAIAASRVVFVPHLIYLDNAWLMAEKRPGTLPPAYRLVLRADLTRLEEALNNAGGEGFRLFRGGVVDTARRFDLRRGGDVRDARHNRHVLAVLQRDNAANKYQYRIVHADDAVALLKQMNEAAAQGYSFAYMWNDNVVMERVSGDSANKGGGL